MALDVAEALGLANREARRFLAIWASIFFLECSCMVFVTFLRGAPAHAPPACTAG